MSLLGERYFVVLGKHTHISLKELELSLAPVKVDQTGEIFIFESPDRKKRSIFSTLSRLGGVVKWGECLTEQQLAQTLTGLSLLGTNDEIFAKHSKKQYSLKRYKTLNALHTDKEVAEKGKEILRAGEFFCLVTGYQDIDFFSCIDFEKPVRGMEVGMMPAKLTQILVSLGVGLIDNKDSPTIYDPFCGFGTTGWIANSLEYHFIGSDINITPAKQNIKRRTTTSYYHEASYITLFKHDVLQKFSKEFVKKTDVMVTEGRLGPVMNKQLLEQHIREKTIDSLLQNIETAYRHCISHLVEFVGKIPLVFTYPQYVSYRHDMSLPLQHFLQQLGYHVDPLDEVYKRSRQIVGRRIILAS